MLADEFFKSFEILKRLYGDKYYNDTRIKLLFKEFGDIKFFHWLDAIDHIINRNRQAPMYDDFKEAVDFILSSKGITSEKPNMDNFDGCNACDYAGWFYIKTIEIDKTYGRQLEGCVSCSCPKGQFLQRASKLPAWESYKNKHLFDKIPAKKSDV